MEKIENRKSNISADLFLKLYLSTMITQKQETIIDNHQLEKDLYMFHNSSNYNFLFEEIIKKDDKINPENSYLDLNTAFKNAYASGILIMIEENGDLMSIINLTEEEAQKLISHFSYEQVKAMKKLYFDVTKFKNNTKEKVLARLRSRNKYHF